MWSATYSLSKRDNKKISRRPPNQDRMKLTNRFSVIPFFCFVLFAVAFSLFKRWPGV